MTISRVLSFTSLTVLACSAFACSSSSTSSTSSDDTNPSGSEVAVSSVSGALNNNSGTGVALLPREPSGSVLDRALAFLNPIGVAQAASWSCSGDTLSPTFTGPTADPYAFTPASCSVTWANGKTASSTWSGPFALSYGSACDDTHPVMEKQAAGCELTRTTASGGDTRSLTGPDGNVYAIDHDTNGSGTGWDSTVTPAPTNDGVEVTCGAGGCASARTLVINGSHLTGTVDIGGSTAKIWDHTVTTGAGGVTVQGSGASRVVSGTVVVQHNLIKAISTTTFTSVGYTEPLCCFPTTGSVSTTFSKGTDTGKTETLTFTNICGEATLVRADGKSEALTMQHCL